ncbi:4-hydroxybenzoate 3-monooxygenase [Actinoplanes sp. N902-109]|uniref:4-hydroxybenzoate 3-monooxygenase n=1 Tax=Actinoplanes sp. (strain N902-109) TaxID=649831 RepID=UPI0003295F4C|nr:4-hydroxybenzoate 3-monooxygenase [Actinoplanes sp. N902-109]AGL21562.1 p-hydroxybenzoate 3-monooxygenase [Actinoplanes sp. N902-109]
MAETAHHTVVIVGAGVAGLTVGNFLRRHDIDCVILERRTRQHVEARQRAGTLDTRGVRLFQEWGLAEVLDAGPTAQVEGGFFLDGQAMPIEVDQEDNESIFIPQQVLVRRLADIYLREGGLIHYEAEVAVDDIPWSSPVVRYRDHTGATVDIRCDYVAGCDGDRGVTRSSIPAGVLTRYSHEFEYSWLSVLAAVPSKTSGMAIHTRGLAGLIPRGTDNSRIYLQCPAGDTIAHWPDERIWDELQARTGQPMERGQILSKEIVALRSVVHDPMHHGRVYLLGDAAHIVPPMSAKGIHLALFDAETFAKAVIAQLRHGDPGPLSAYSDTCLHHVWNYQAFATWITDLMHDAGDPSYKGEFRKQVARAELRRQFESEAANRVFSELTSGIA